MATIVTVSPTFQYHRSSFNDHFLVFNLRSNNRQTTALQPTFPPPNLLISMTLERYTIRTSMYAQKPLQSSRP